MLNVKITNQKMLSYETKYYDCIMYISRKMKLMHNILSYIGT